LQTDSDDPSTAWHLEAVSLPILSTSLNQFVKIRWAEFFTPSSESPMSIRLERKKPAHAGTAYESDDAG
jgi:hypothetical protein